MKISHLRSQILVLPETDPLADSPENPNAARPIVILRVGTDDGIEGIAVTFYGGAMTRSLKAAVDDLGALTIGEDPLRLEATIAKLRAAAGGSGHPRQGAEPAFMETSRRGARACPDLCERFAAS